MTVQAITGHKSTQMMKRYTHHIREGAGRCREGLVMVVCHLGKDLWLRKNYGSGIADWAFIA